MPRKYLPVPRIAIYGFFLRGICLYIGQSVNPHSRPFQNQRERKIPRKAKLRILRWTTCKHANRLEREAIAEYKAKGQAKFNKRVMGAVTHRNIGRLCTITLQKAARTGEPASFIMGDLHRVRAY
jgi:hypothetical protein